MSENKGHRRCGCCGRQIWWVRRHGQEIPHTPIDVNGVEHYRLTCEKKKRQEAARAAEGVKENA